MVFNQIQLALSIMAISLLACRSTDKATQICEDNNTECHQNCSNSNANFSNTRISTQPIGPCDTRCDKNYQACLKRRQDKGVKIIGDY